jgi:DNA-binding NarL/FixJ family response regulator
MQNESFYKRLGACMNLATNGATPGEKSSGATAVKRLLAKLDTEEVRIFLNALPSNVPRKPRKHKIGTKREKVVELLQAGYRPKDIATMLEIRPQYVYNVRKEWRQGL